MATKIKFTTQASHKINKVNEHSTQEELNEFYNSGEYLHEMIDRFITALVRSEYPGYIPKLDDIKQDVFIKAFTTKRYDATKGMISTYLVRIGRNHIIDMYRRSVTARKHGLVNIDSGYAALPEELWFEEDDAASRIDINAKLEEAMAKLDEEGRTILEHRFIYGTKNGVVCENLKLSTRTYYRRQLAAKNNLKRIVMEDADFVDKLAILDISTSPRAKKEWE